MSKIKENKVKKDHGTRNMIIFLIVFSIVCIGITMFFIFKNNNHKINNIMENVKNNATNKSEQNNDIVSGVVSLNDTYVENALKISKVKFDLDGNNTEKGIYIQFDGLKNVELQQNINENIKNKLIEWCNSNNEKKVTYFDVNCTANFANVISIKGVKYFSSNTKPDFFVMNIDLTTGNEIKFNEMFTKNAGIKGIISESAYDTFTVDATGGEMSTINNEPVFSDEEQSDGFYYETEKEKRERNEKYSQIEDKVFKLVNGYNNDNNLKFNFSPRCVYIYNDDDIITINMKNYYNQIAIYNRFKNNDIYDGKYENQDIIENKNIPVFVSTNTTNVDIDVVLSEPVNIVYMNQQKKSDNIFYGVIIDKYLEEEDDSKVDSLIENIKKVAIEKINKKEEENKKDNKASFYQLKFSINDDSDGTVVNTYIKEYSVSENNRANLYDGVLNFLQNGNYEVYWSKDDIEYDNDINPWRKYISNPKEISCKEEYIYYSYNKKSKELVLEKEMQNEEENQTLSENNNNENQNEVVSNNKTIVIDAGHQAKGNNEKEPIGPGASETKAKVTDGATGVSTGQKESELNLKVSQMLEQELTKKGYNVIMTRTEENVNMSNSERAQIANNANATAFIRIHANSADSSSAKGVLTMCQTSQNKYNGNFADKSYSLSKSIVDNVAKATGTQNRGVTRTDDMSGINWCKVPATIVEMGFLSNSDEDKLLADENYQKKIVNGIINGLEEYLNS